MVCVRRLFEERGLLHSSDVNALKIPTLDPWCLRAQALDRRLEPAELAVALGHIARHRGFRSNSKRDRGANAPSDTSKMLNSMETTRDKLSKYRSVGEMFHVDPAFENMKRNRDGGYSHSVLRSDLESESFSNLCSPTRAWECLSRDCFRGGLPDCSVQSAAAGG